MQASTKAIKQTTKRKLSHFEQLELNANKRGKKWERVSTKRDYVEDTEV